jgi:Tetratricopeptide repeat
VQVIEARKTVVGQEHPNTLTSMASLAPTYRNQGRFREAEELEVQVVRTRKRVLGQEHPSMLSRMENLACTYRSQGRFREAEVLQESLLVKRRRVLSEDHPDVDQYSQPSGSAEPSGKVCRGGKDASTDVGAEGDGTGERWAVVRSDLHSVTPASGEMALKERI